MLANTPEQFETEYVHKVYSSVADQFSSTRHTAWGKVRQFVSKIDSKSKIVDIGCGNGKHMRLRPQQFFGCDINKKFVDICSKQNLSVVHGDILNIPFEDNHFDYTLCIAVIHHLSNDERRLKSINELVRITKPTGKIFIQVWALEQEDESKHKFTEQDTFVTWGNDKLKRYYHIFKKGELEELVCKVENVTITESFYECGNWGVILQKR